MILLSEVIQVQFISLNALMDVLNNPVIFGVHQFMLICPVFVKLVSMLVLSKIPVVLLNILLKKELINMKPLLTEILLLLNMINGKNHSLSLNPFLPILNILFCSRKKIKLKCSCKWILNLFYKIWIKKVVFSKIISIPVKLCLLF